MALVPFDDRDGMIWYDGVLVPWRDAKLHILSHGLHYASGVFEGERAYGGHVFKLRAHTDRLIASGRLLGFEIPYSAEQIDAACRQVLAANNQVEAYVRPIAWRGTEQLSVSAQATKIHFAIATWAWPNLFGEDRMKGVRLGLAAWKRPHPETAPTASKAAGLYMIGTLSKHKAEAEGFDDALMLDWRGQVAEAYRRQHLLRVRRRAAYPHPGLLPERHHPPHSDLDRPAPRYQGGGTADLPRRDGARQRGFPGRHRRRGHAGAPDRRHALHAGEDHRDAAARLRNTGAAGTR